MKATVWRRQLVEADWNFPKCQNNEWEQCLAWEIFREKEQAANDGVFPDRTIRVFGSTREMMAARFNSNGKFGKLVKQDFRPYIEKRQGELWRPIKQDELNHAWWISTDWHTVVRHCERELKEAETHFSTVIMEDKTTEVVPLKIPWHWRDKLIVEAFSHWLKENRPPEIEFYTPPKNKGGNGSRIRQAKADLKCLAACRLLEHYKNRPLAFSYGGEYLGKDYLGSSAWTDAKKKVALLLKRPPPWAGIRFK